MSVIKPEMVTREITRHDVLPMSFLKKSAYTGSKRGLRYRMAKTEVEKPAADEETAPVPDAADAVNASSAGGSGQAAAEASPDAAKTQPADAKTQPAADKPQAAEEKAPEMITVLRVWAWSSKLSFDNTPEEDFHIKDFEFCDAGIDEALAFLNEELEELEAI